VYSQSFLLGAVVIDIGINRIKDKDGKTHLVGDCDFEGISQVSHTVVNSINAL